MIERILLWVLAVTLAIGAWYSVLRFGLVSPAVLATPREVAVAFPRLVLPSDALPDTLSTVERSLLAFGISVPLGVLSGFAVFYGGRFREPSEFMLDFLRSIPATALVPVFLVVFGVDDTAKIAVGVFSS